jgi:hypothetical protein
MGYNTSLIIMNDALDQIASDSLFGRHVSEAVSQLDHMRHLKERTGLPFYGFDVPAGNSANAATVIETHHADATSVVAFGGNRGVVLGEHLYGKYREGESEEEAIFRALADKLGYQVRKAPMIQRATKTWDM